MWLWLVAHTGNLKEWLENLKRTQELFMIEKIPSSRQVSWDLYIGVQGYSSVREKSFSQWGSSKGLQVRTSSIQDELMHSPPSQSSWKRSNTCLIYIVPASQTNSNYLMISDNQAPEPSCTIWELKQSQTTPPPPSLNRDSITQQSIKDNLESII